MRNEQIAKQEKLKERRKKIKEKKAIAITNAKKATKTVRIEPKTGDTSDTDEENHASKRSTVASRDPPAKKVHKTSVRVQVKMPTDAGRNSRNETTKAPVSEKSKKGRRMGEQTTPAH
jgi:hypothetical protein